MRYKPQVRNIICADCGELFDSDAPRVKYCLKCRLKRFHPKNPTEIKTCLYCGEEFETSRSWSKFCKPACKAAYHRQRYEEMVKGGEVIH